MVEKNPLKRVEWLALIVILIFALVVYVPILKGFFQNDEWLAFVLFFVDDQSLLAILKRSLIDTGHFVPLFEVGYRLLIKLFGLNYVPYAAVSLVMHLLVVILVFFTARKFFKEKSLLTFITTAFFALSAAGHQATTWPLINVSTHSAMIFALLSLLAFLEGRLTLTIGLLFASLFFKEIAVGFFVFLPLLNYFFSRDDLGKKLRVTLVFGISGAAYLVVRLTSYLLAQSDTYLFVTQTSSKLDLVKNLLGFPFKAIYETVVPPRFLLLIAHEIGSWLPASLTGLKGTTAFDLFSEQVSLPVVGFLIVSLLVLVYLKNRKKNLDSKFFLVGSLFVVINSFVYALSPQRPDPIPIIDSRNLYFPTFGTSLMLTSLLSMAFNKRKLLILLGTSVLFLINVYWLRWEINSLNQTARVRKAILAQIKAENPQLPERVVFYTESDRSYYGLPESEPIMPFQTNFGLDLFAWYAPTEKFSRGFVDGYYKFFLFELTEQGYRETETGGFGYFRDFGMLKETVDTYGLLDEAVIGYRYHSDTEMLENISLEVRQKL